MIPAAMVEEMRAGALARCRAKVAAMTMDEIRAEHDRECAAVERMGLLGQSPAPCDWILDRIAVLQEARASIGPALARVDDGVPRYHSIEQIDGVRLRHPVRCF